ncbi:DivIVA domain-containing protein, partial [Dietzia sp. SLG510A3-40A3]|nr:DivIVA domain-containing protein [Dietzia sp. SLG510A3-40A3]
MPLTPADVHNVAFSKPPIGKRGYNEDEVDQFLDLVETELAELVSDNEDLRQRVEELTKDLEKARKAVDESGKSSGAATGGSGTAQQPAAPAPAP